MTGNSAVVSNSLFKKVLVANRGEIALRVLRACKELDIKTVAVFSEADKESLHVHFADEAVCIGPAPSKQSYLSIANIIAAAKSTGADAIHPGYGFLAENAGFSQACQEHKIKFIGPSPEMTSALGDKYTAKAHMKKANVPTVPGSDGLLQSVEEGLQLARQIRYPVVLKATAGGGGRGIRFVYSDAEFEKAWKEAKSEAASAFGNDAVYLEKLVEEPRHVEIQILGDQYGNVIHLSERDCTVQRRNQKLTEETPCPVMTDELRERMGNAAVAAAKAIRYEGAGTFEFLVDKNLDFYFMEMNARIQVEHGITEEVTGLDLVKEQIRIAAGWPLPQTNFFPTRYAMECRINAEDPMYGFRPSAGKITNLHFPGGCGVRVDSYLYAGYTIPSNYDSLIAKLIVTGSSRDECRARMKRALQEFVIEGVKTTIPFHIKLMDDPKFASGKYTTKFMENFDFTDMRPVPVAC